MAKQLRALVGRFSIILLGIVMGLVGGAGGYGFAVAFGASAAAGVVVGSLVGVALMKSGVPSLVAGTVIGAFTAAAIAEGVSSLSVEAILVGGVAGAAAGALPLPIRVACACGCIAFVAAGAVPGVSGAGEASAGIAGAVVGFAAGRALSKDNCASRLGESSGDRDVS